MDSMRWARRMLAVSVAIVSLGTGCAELITYSNQSNEQGEKLAAQGQYEDAAGAFANATEQNPRNYKAFYNLGQSYEKLGRDQQALQSYRTALEVMPTSDTGRSDFAFRDKAVDALAKCVAKSDARDAEITLLQDKAARSGTPVDWFVVARTFAELGDADNAFDAYDRALLASGKGDASIAKSYGLYLVQVNQRKHAEVVLVKAYQLNPEDAEVASALRQIGIVPGPSLLEPDQLTRPFIPKGPLPELEIQLKDSNNSPSASSDSN